MKEASIRNFCLKFKNGDFKNSLSSQIDAGWFDWKCRNEVLYIKTKKLGDIITKLKDGGKINLDDWYVWFKNIKMKDGIDYDDIRFSDIKTNELQYVIQIQCSFHSKKYCIIGHFSQDLSLNENQLLFETCSKKELINWLNKG